MARLTVSWLAECDYCENKLGEDYSADSCPDEWDFDTERCSFCDVEVCKNCMGKDTDIHKRCQLIMELEEKENNSEGA